MNARRDQTHLPHCFGITSLRLAQPKAPSLRRRHVFCAVRSTISIQQRARAHSVPAVSSHQQGQRVHRSAISCTCVTSLLHRHAHSRACIDAGWLHSTNVLGIYQMALGYSQTQLIMPTHLKLAAPIRLTTSRTQTLCVRPPSLLRIQLLTY